MKTPPAVEAWYYSVVHLGLRSHRIRDLSTIQAPVTIATGVVVPDSPHSLLPALGRALAAAVPGASFREFRGLDHFGPLVEPEVVAGHVKFSLLGSRGHHGENSESGAHQARL